MTTESAGPQTPDPATAASTGDASIGDADVSPATAVTAALARAEPVLCHHCGRTASNGISCQGICVADSGY
jgi:hypothetical protein